MTETARTRESRGHELTDEEITGLSGAYERFGGNINTMSRYFGCPRYTIE